MSLGILTVTLATALFVLLILEEVPSALAFEGPALGEVMMDADLMQQPGARAPDFRS